MSSQGFYGALKQYWTVNDKPRLDRRNTFFEDCKVSNIDALRLGLISSVLAIAIIVSWSVML